MSSDAAGLEPSSKEQIYCLEWEDLPRQTSPYACGGKPGNILLRLTISFNTEAFGHMTKRVLQVQATWQETTFSDVEGREREIQNTWHVQSHLKGCHLLFHQKHEEYTFPSSEWAYLWALWARLTTIFVLYPRKSSIFDDNDCSR